MKKVLSFVLVLAMILGSVSMAFAAPAKTIEKTPVPFEDAENSKVATILRDLGVLTGDNGKALLNETITRAELCAVLVRALGYDAIGKVPTATKFTDVDATAWYSGYVAVANTMGYVDGITATQFMPEETVTGYEAVAFLLKAVGYDAAHLSGSWPMNYVSKAQETNVLKDFVPTNDVVTRDDVFTLIYNGLGLKLVKWNKENEEYYTYKYDDNVENTLFTKLGGGNWVYDVEDDILNGEYVDADGHIVFGNDFDATKYLGKYVEVIWKGKIDSDGDWYDDGIIGLGKVLSTTVEGKFTEDPDDVELQETSFAAIDKIYDLSKADVTYGTEFLLNGAVATPVEDYKITSKTAVSMEVEFASGKIATIYSISVFSESAVKLINATEAAYLADGNVASYNAIDGQTYWLPTKDLSEDDDTEVLDEALITIEGDATKLADIKEDDIVEIYAEKDTDMIRKLVVTRKVVSGSVTKFNTTNNKFTVNGKEYSFATVKVVPAGATITQTNASTYALYLNAEGKVAYATIPGITKAVDDEYTYAFVLASALKPADSSTLDATKANYQVRLLVAGESEAKDYTNVTTGAMDNMAASWTNVLKAGTLAKVKFDEDGKIAKIDAVVKETEGKKATGVAIGLKFENESKRYSDDVVVVEMTTDAGSKLGKAENYVKKSTASLEGNAIEPAYIVVDEDTEFITLVVYAKDTKTIVGGKTNQVTAAAFISSEYELVDDENVTYASFYVNGDVKKYVLYDREALGKADKGTFFNFEFDGENIYDEDLAHYTATETELQKAFAVTDDVDVKLADNNLYITIDETKYAFDDAVTVYKNVDGANTVAKLADVKKAETVILWDVDGDGYVDTVLLNYDLDEE